MPGKHDPLTDLLATATTRGTQAIEPSSAHLGQLVAGRHPYGYRGSVGGDVDVRVVLEWLPAGRITVDALGRLAFPVLPDKPGLYRFTWNDKVCGHRTYIGQTDNLWRRLIGYRHPGPSQTDQRVNALLVEHLSAGGVGEVAVVTSATMQVDGHAAELQFGRETYRMLAENAALVQTAVAGDTDIVNVN